MNRLAPPRYDYLCPPLWDRQLALGKFKFRLTVSQEQARESAHAALCPIANRVAALRRERGMSCPELAWQLGIHSTTLVALESGSYLPSLELALRVSSFFGLPVQAIFFARIDEDTIQIDSDC